MPSGWWPDFGPGSGASPVGSPAGVAPGAPSPLAPVFGDWDVLTAARDTLAATGEFDGVYLSDLPEVTGRPGGDRNAAFVAPKTWAESSDSEDPLATVLTRRVGWTLTLAVRRADADQRDRDLTRLLAVAQNALDGRSIGGLTIPAWTRLKTGRYDTASPPERRMTVTGEFAYVIQGSNAHPARS